MTCSLRCVSAVRRLVLILVALQSAAFLPAAISQAPEGADFGSRHLALGLARDYPRFTYFSVDSLGGSKLATNVVLSTEASRGGSLTLANEGPGRFAYRAPGASTAAWVVECSESGFVLRSQWKDGMSPAPAFELVIAQKANHATLLGLMKPGERRVTLPAVLHLPDLGSLRIRAHAAAAALDYDARRSPNPADGHDRNFVKVSFPAATATRPHIEYRLETALIHPSLAGLDRDPLFDGFRRSYLNIFQLNPHIQMLANNSSSDACAFTVFKYAEVARHAPALVDDLHPLDLIRMTLDRYLAGAKAYGQAGYGPTAEAPDLGRWHAPFNSLDTLPSLLLAACIYAEAKSDSTWARHHYARLREWGREMLSSDRNGNGLIEYPQSGNCEPNDRPGLRYRPANWWDAIMFGHEDAYSNALAFRAASEFAKLARKVGNDEDATYFAGRAAALRSAYVRTFLNPATGMLAGWKSADGELHDYAFVFVPAVAITYGLIDPAQANELMDRVLARMEQVGFRSYRYGLPGNLVPIRRCDHYKHGPGGLRWGEPTREDGTDGFQIYENGGVTSCYAYFTYHALYRLGRVDDARRLFLPTLRTLSSGGFQGFDESGQSIDWRDWSGRGHGYEGFLVDNYLTFLAVFDEIRARANTGAAK